MRRLLAALGAILALCAPAAALAGSLTLLGAGKPPGGGGGGGGSPPAYSWVTSGDISTTSTSVTTSKGANSINSGDTLVILADLNDSSNTNHSMTCPTGFTQATGSTWTSGTAPNFDNGTNSGINIDLCWKVAGGSETGSYTLNWTTGNTLVGLWTLMRFTGANATTPLEDSGVQNNGSSSNSTSTVTPSVTSGGSNRLLVSCAAPWKTGQTFTVPSGMTSAFATSGANQRMACATLTVNSGATGTKTWTIGVSAASQGISFLLQP